MPRVKTSLNRLIDDLVHPRGHPRDIATILADEALHSLIEGGFRPDKFLRYTLLPEMRLPVGRCRPRGRKHRQSQALLSLVKCARCGEYVPFGFEVWVDGKPHCGNCALIKAAEAKR